MRGGMAALFAALLFGASTPLVQRFGAVTSVFWTAALLYAGGAAIGALLRQSAQREARVRPGDALRLVSMALFGAVLGPVALVWGLKHTDATGASLVLSLEAVFTAILAWLLYHEAMDRRIKSALALISLGGMLLVFDRNQSHGGGVIGLAAVVVATLAWALDNALSRPLADRDPGQVVMIKSTLGATISAVIAGAVGEALPGAEAAALLMATGALGYGLSLHFYLRAQRLFGAARTGSVFAFSPFIGGIVAIALGQNAGGALTAVGALLMVIGVVIHLLEDHGHDHLHEALEHEHAHRHDDLHHDHVHEPAVVGSHSHQHRHEPMRHTHVHVPDLHHTHEH